MNSKIAKFIYWTAVATLTGVILCSCNQQLVNSYQYVLPTVVTISGDRLDDQTNEICGIGTGFFISNEYVLTMAHITDRLLENTIELQLWNGQKISAKTIAVNRLNDLALLQINLDDVKSYKIPKLNLKTYPQIGEVVFIVGSPYLFPGTMTAGILSRRASVGKYWKCEVYFADITVEEGNSGSPVFNARREVIGIAKGYYGMLTVMIPSYSIRAFLKDSISD